MLLENPELGGTRAISRIQDLLSRVGRKPAERLGRVLLKAGKIDQAVTAFQQGRARRPTRPRAPRLSLNLAEVYAKRDQPREALTHLDEFIRSQPQGMDGYEMKIVLLRKLNRAADIVPELEAAAANDHHNNSLKLVLAREYRKAAGAAERRPWR